MAVTTVFVLGIILFVLGIAKVTLPPLSLKRP